VEKPAQKVGFYICSPRGDSAPAGHHPKGENPRYHIVIPAGDHPKGEKRDVLLQIAL